MGEISRMGPLQTVTHVRCMPDLFFKLESVAFSKIAARWAPAAFWQSPLWSGICMTDVRTVLYCRLPRTWVCAMEETLSVRSRRQTEDAWESVQWIESRSSKCVWSYSVTPWKKQDYLGDISDDICHQEYPVWEHFQLMSRLFYFLLFVLSPENTTAWGLQNSRGVLFFINKLLFFKEPSSVFVCYLFIYSFIYRSNNVSAS